MSIMANGSKAVSVLRNDNDATKPWLVCCGLCRESLFGPSFPTVLQAVRWSADWSTAQAWAQKHAEEHERRRCATCGHLPTGALDETERANA